MANQTLIPRVIQIDYITFFDEIIQHGSPMKDIKAQTNKLFNIFRISITRFTRMAPPSGLFLDVIKQNIRNGTNNG